MILVSHDRWLLDRVATAILSFEPEGRIEFHVGNYSDYRERRPRRTRGKPASRSQAPKTVSATAQKAKKSTQPKRLNSAERRELEGLPDEIESAEAEVGRLQTALADPETYQGDGRRGAMLREELELAEAAVERLSARWEALEVRA